MPEVRKHSAFAFKLFALLFICSGVLVWSERALGQAPSATSKASPQEGTLRSVPAPASGP